MTTCTIAGCKRSRHARGLCRNHYERQKRTGSAILQRDSRVDDAKRLLATRPLTVAQLADGLKISKPTAQKVIVEIGAARVFALQMTDNGAGAPTPFYSCQRPETVAACRTIQSLLTARPDLSAKEVAAMAGVNAATMRRHIDMLHNVGLVHIGRWTRVKHVYEMLWRLGPGIDAPKPAPMTVAQRNAKRALLVKIDPDAAESQRIAHRRYHVRTKLKPKRDPLVAALFGDAR